MRRGSKPSGRMIQASISPDPSVVGTANRSQPRNAARDGGDRAVEGDDLGGVLDRSPGPWRGAPPAASNAAPRSARWSAARRRRAVGGEAVQVGLAAVLGRGEQGVVVEPHRRAQAGGRGERAVEPVEIQRC